MKKTLWALSAIAVLGFGMTGCGDEEACYTNDAGVDIICGDVLSGMLGKQYCVTSRSGKNVCSANDACQDGQEFDDTGACVNKNSEIVGCSSNSQCEGGKVCDPVDHECVDPSSATKAFKYVRIDDASEGKYTGEWDDTKKCAKTTDGKCENDPGADLDAVVLVKGANTSYVSDIIDYKFGIAAAKVKFNKDDKSAPKLATNPLNIVSAPDSISNYGTDNAECKLFIDPEADNCFGNADVPCKDRPFVSLGGPGGYIIVEMEDAIEAGDKLDILEVGDCKLANCDTDSADKCGKSKAVADGVKVYVSMSDSTTNDWKVISDTAKAPQKGVINLDITSALLEADSKTLE